MTSEPKKVDRRKFIYAGLGAVALIAIGAAAYVAMNPPVVTQTVTTSTTVPTTSIVTTTTATTVTTSAPTSELRLTYWQNDTRPGDRAGAYAVINEFEKENPNIKIDVEFVPWEVAQQKFLAAVEAKQLPDTHQGWGLASVPNANYRVEFDDYVNEWRKEHPGEIFDICWRILDLQDPVGFYLPDEKEHHFFGMPWFAGYEPVLWVNMKIFRENGLSEADIPETWDELVQVAIKCTKPPEYWGFEFIGAGIGQPWWMIRYQLQRWGCDFVKEVEKGKYKVAFDNQDGLEALKAYFDLALKYKVTPPSMVSDTYKEVANMFATGRVAMVTGIGPWNLLTWINALGDDLYIAPAPKGPKGAPIPFVQTCPIIAYNTEKVLKNKDKVFKWLSFWSTRKGQELWFSAPGCGLPVSQPYFKQLAEDEKVGKWYKAFYDGFMNAKEMSPRLPGVLTLFSDPNTMGYVQAVLTGKMTVEEFQKTLAKMIADQLREAGALAE
jgi:multiple sugar transport system substrate-binding protein